MRGLVIDPKIRRGLDGLALAGLILLLLFLWFRGGPGYARSWDFSALIRAFFRLEDGALVPGPLGIGLINTFRICFWTLWIAGAIGLCIGLLRSSLEHLPRMLGACLVAVLRNMPPLVLVFIIHFFFSIRVAGHIPWGWVENLPGGEWLFPSASRMPVFFSAVLTLSLYEGAYVGEIVRAGIACVPKGQWEAAQSLGFGRAGCLFRIILPQALRFILPPLSGQLASLVKDSAILAVISMQELTFQGMEFINSSGLAGEVWLGVTVCYLLICLVISFAGRRLEARLSTSGNQM